MRRRWFGNGWGRRWAAKTQNVRIRKKAKARARRIRGLVYRDRATLKLVMSGVAPQQSYGHVVNGATANQTQDMRTNLKTATPYGGTGACTASVLSCFFGATADSFVKNSCERFYAWY